MKLQYDKSSLSISFIKNKKAIWNSKETGLTEALNFAWSLISEQNIHADFKEGTMAFIEKRSPKWKPYSEN